ncbi:MAG: sensor histidine kinase [Firmicutes bacterium]|nr:sensor histidine kinase [Bacillota bacterium]
MTGAQNKRDWIAAIPELAAEDAAVLRRTCAQMQYMADLCNNDIFLDCPLSEDKALVVAHAGPSSGASVYGRDVSGEIATIDKEPAVFRAIAEAIPICDIKAETQEGRQVRQNACPVMADDGRVIGVLIREKDISEDIVRDEKYEQLAKLHAENQPALRTEDTAGESVAMREVHHRVKNNLQIVASMLNLQARAAEDETLKDILKENVGRVQSIASIHDILTHDADDMRSVDSSVLLERLRSNLTALMPAGKSIDIVLEGDSISLDPETATAVALVVNELVTNALRHGYPEKSSGTVAISVCKGALIHTIIVSDDGCGFDPSQVREGSLGLFLVRATVQDKLKGKLHIASSPEGTKVSFDFKNE